MVLITGCPSGEYIFCDNRHTEQTCQRFAYRTSQEELRHYNQSESSSKIMTNASAESSLNENEPQDSNASGLLSTETLIYIHGGLMGALFTVALFR